MPGKKVPEQKYYLTKAKDFKHSFIVELTNKVIKLYQSW